MAPDLERRAMVHTQVWPTSQLGDEHKELYCAIIMRAMDDIEFLEGLNGRPSKRGSEISSHDPYFFIASQQFEEYCRLLSVDPDRIRKELKKRYPKSKELPLYLRELYQKSEELPFHLTA